ncbi:cell division protein FtsQ [Tamilnaduibacter salinus]|uniref:Cell division protein FtsQ n=1 Tax=Tamilnaduibacter salinus TaxID=1484056 RepID=A0A2A2I408_9GAMM|nr:cell division protein FtsQ/DivIB [Tamilnaduibacter salinus]PAV26036.1 cell division protein FtsQ [Tamilnaduibacter salinus]
MFERILMPTRNEPPRRGASPMDSGGGDGLFRVLSGWLAMMPWAQLGLAMTVLLFAAAMPWATGQVLDALDRQIARVDVEGEFQRLEPGRLKNDLNALVGRSYFATDLEDVKRTLEQEPWVASAAIRRVWPDQLTVDIREKQPLAYWNQQSLISRRGQVFQPSNPQAAGPLPRLSGPTGREDDVLGRARAMSDRLQTEGLTLAGLALAPRGAWTLTLDNGVIVALGRTQVGTRLDRFLTVYSERLASRIRDIRRVDARYTNGVAVQWKQSRPDNGKNS